MSKIYKIFFSFLLFGFLPLSAVAASLSISPQSGTFEVGDKVTARVMVSSSESINAISGQVSFPAAIFNVESVSKAGSILNFWVSEPDFSAGVGTLQFEGVALNGFQGGTGTVISVVLRAVKVGSGNISFKSGKVLANDGQGSDVTGSLTGATLSVEAKKEVSKPVSTPVKSQIEEQTETQELSQDLKLPEIVSTIKFGEPAISGISDYPQAQVTLTFVAESGVKVSVAGATDNHGEFLLLVPQTLKGGTYKVFAIVKKDSDNYVSNEITISVGNILSDMSFGIKLTILILIIIIVYLIIRIYLYLQKKKKIKHEIKEAEFTLHRSFKLLEDEANREMKKDLNEAEGLIAKEIKDIEKT
jgi:hypothetical protein